VTTTMGVKQELLAAIGRADAAGRYAEGDLDEVHRLVQALVPLTPVPRPFDRQEFVAGPWGTLFAQFGPKHTAGKPVVHETDFRLLTFGNLPNKPMRLLSIEQEIHHVGKDYNNVHLVETIDKSLQAHLIVFGRYRLEQAEPQRYGVDFYRVELRPLAGSSGAAVRAAFGFEAAQPLSVDLKPPKLHSDVVYCDDDMRINFGSVGGVYVMNRLRHAGASVRFD
jgi:hypothetical protein